MLVDSGSLYTIIPKALYDSLFSECKLHKSNISPDGYGGSPIAIQGFFKATLQYKDHSHTDKAYISKNGATILGWSVQSELCIALDPICNDPRIPDFEHHGSVSRSFRTQQYKSHYTCFTQNTVETRSAQSVKCDMVSYLQKSSSVLHRRTVPSRRVILLVIHGFSVAST